MPKPAATMTTAEAARVLGVSPRYVRLVKSRIGHTTHGKLLVFRATDVRRFARERSGGG